MVTGAGGGMGLAIANALSSAGARVMALDLKPRPANLATAVAYEQGDVTDEAFIASAARNAAIDGALHALVNAAGVVLDGDGAFETMDLAAWRRTLDINLTGAALVSRAALPYLKAGRGSMVHIASVVGLRNMENILAGGPLDAYQASKHALVGLSRSFAMQYAAAGVRSNTICPGAVRTPMTEEIYRDPARVAAMAARTPLGRVGMPEDIASAALFLLSEDASFITAIDLVVDGGIMAKL
ncbi:MAG: SDR family NAD(P)-dependent oxidoreductase [Alphaproteobacteria bacterium]